MFSSLYRENPLLAVSGQAGRQLQLASCTLVGGQLLAGLDHTLLRPAVTTWSALAADYSVIPRRFQEDKAR